MIVGILDKYYARSYKHTTRSFNLTKRNFRKPFSSTLQKKEGAKRRIETRNRKEIVDYRGGES
jgi:hypothetical protein